MVLTDKVYEDLKWLVQIFLPAAATFYAALAALWGFPCVEQVVGTIGAITVFLGACLKISNANYTGEGTLTIDGSEYALDLNKEASELSGKKTVTIAVNTK